MNADPELASEVVGFLGRELKTARNRVKELEAHLQLSNQVRFFALPDIHLYSEPSLISFSGT